MIRVLKPNKNGDVVQILLKWSLIRWLNGNRCIPTF